MLFETRCAGCDLPGAPICPACRFALMTYRRRGPRKPGETDVVTAVTFGGRARDVVLALKYRNRRPVGRHLAGLLVNRLIETGELAGVDVVTWAPTSSERRRHRGFDQGELVARAVARQLGLPCRRLLDRRGPAVAQTGRSRSERLHGPVFVAHPAADGRGVLVVDDVVTTGATLRAARSALLARGASQVVLAGVASTPDARPRRIVQPAAVPVRPAAA
jgi:ComF family protein